MGSSQPPGPALVAAVADADPVTLLITAWLSARRSENTRAAYARDIGITPQRRPGRAPPWLDWCQQHRIHPVTGITALHVAQYARQLDDAGLSPASAARKLGAISSWYAWLARRGHITASPAGIARPRPGPRTAPALALTRDQALALVHAADTAPGPQRARTAALVAVLLFTGARVSEVIGADVGDLGTDQGRRVLRVTRANGRRQSLALPGPAASRIDAYLAGRPGLTGVPVLFATRTGGRLFAADVRQAVRRLATRADLPADLTSHLGPRMMRHSFAAIHAAELERVRADAARERESRAQVLEESRGELRARAERAERELHAARAELARARRESGSEETAGPPRRHPGGQSPAGK